MTPEELDAIRERQERAWRHVSNLCSGKARWTMSIPARPTQDSDLVIGASLADIQALLDEVTQLRVRVPVDE